MRIISHQPGIVHVVDNAGAIVRTFGDEAEAQQLVAEMEAGAEVAPWHAVSSEPGRQWFDEPGESIAPRIIADAVLGPANWSKPVTVEALRYVMEASDEEWAGAELWELASELAGVEIVRPAERTSQRLVTEPEPEPEPAAPAPAVVVVPPGWPF